MQEINPSPQLREVRKQLIGATESYYTMLKAKANDDLYIFNKYVLDAQKGNDKFVLLSPFHKDMCNFITDNRLMKKLALLPRGHLKTKLITIGYSVQKIATNPQVRILIYSATWQMAVDIHLSIQKILQTTEKLIDIYGDFSKGAPVWSADRTRVKENTSRDPTITAAGIDNNLVGGHYDLIIMDDVVSRDNTNTMDQINKVILRYKDSLDLLEPNGELIVIGTRWHDSDLYGWILDDSNEARANYKIMVKKAYEGNLLTGEEFVPLWKEKFSREELMRRLKEKGWAEFSSQYLNNPVPEENAIFKRPWFQYYEGDDIKGKLFNKFLLIDPAVSQAKEADYTAMIVPGIDEWGNIYILDILRMRLSPRDIIEEIFKMKEKWNVSDVALEQVAFQKVLGYSLREDMRFKMKPFHITELKPNERTKDQRIRGLQPLYENGKIFHNRSLLNNIYLEDELVRYPKTKHDDIIDALAYSMDILYPAKQVSTKKRSRHKYIY